MSKLPLFVITGASGTGKTTVSSATREMRLQARGWDENAIEDHRNFANWLLQNADKAFDPAMPTVDTTDLSSEEAAKQIEEWVRANW
ncbi:hypothetical protein [Paenibacillus xylanexedens]|uniref:hypothetical protein n=1 Tax=Paenibacillus sp. FSL R7-0272 TaxID=2921679 RepID=UPI0012B89C7D|nr:hypothetical protein [Paenibacillus xylanexedens]